MIFETNRDRSLGPDEFNLEFLKRCWGIVGGDVIGFVQEFHKLGKLPKTTTSSFLALVPKIDNPERLDAYRLICLIVCLYKVISKLLVKGLIKVIGKVISSNQTTFIPGRKILDGILVTNKVLDYAKRKRKDCMLCKVDFQQACDCVDCDFLRKMLREMGFGQKWMDWMEARVFTSSMYILVNGSPTT